jgi:hypothetical protein
MPRISSLPAAGAITGTEELAAVQSGQTVKVQAQYLGATTFTALTDTPANYTGAAEKVVAVNGAGTGLEFIDPPTEVTIGTSGATVGLLNGNNTHSGNNTFSGTFAISGTNHLLGSYGAGGVTSNFAAGNDALIANTTGSENVAVGLAALGANTTGLQNVACGAYALYGNTEGRGNVALGNSAMISNETGSGNTSLNPIDSAGAYEPIFDPVDENNRFCMGSTSVTNAYIQVAWTVVSDARDKTDLAPVPLGLDFLCQLKPVAYRYKKKREDTEGHGPVRYGFLAQEVLALEGPDSVVIDAENPDKLRMVDQNLIAVMVQAIQELKAEFDAYKLAHP